MSKGKFDSILSEFLYSDWTPTSEVGSSSEGVGWAGLYGEVGVILQEATDGTVTHEILTHDTISLRWAEVESELTIGDQPAEDDYVVGESDRIEGGFIVHQFQEHFAKYEEALDAIWNDMEESNFYPDVWLVNERGDFTKITEDITQKRE